MDTYINDHIVPTIDIISSGSIIDIRHNSDNLHNHDFYLEMKKKKKAIFQI